MKLTRYVQVPSVLLVSRDVRYDTVGKDSVMNEGCCLIQNTDGLKGILLETVSYRSSRPFRERDTRTLHVRYVTYSQVR